MVKTRNFSAGIAAALLFVSTAAWSCETGQSCLPDTDQTGLNNSFEAAEDLGTLGSDATGQPRVVSRNGELGKVQDGFDSVDFYKFRLPLNQFEVTISSTEDPATSSWIMIYDANRRPLISEEQGKGHDNESVTLNLSSGVYYVSVRTDANVARDRFLKYTLKIAPSIRALPDQGAAGCQSAQTFMQATSGAVIQGSINGPMAHSAYAIYLTNGSQFVASPSNFPRLYEAVLVDRTTGDRIQIVQANTNGVRFIALDPGLYCLEVSAGTFSTSPINYQFTIGAPNMGFPPATIRSNAPCVTMLNLGNLSRNGQYGSVRQPQMSNPNTPCYFDGQTQYVMREWIGPQRAEEWFRFDLQGARKLEFRMSSLYEPVRAEIQDSQGNILATSVAEGISLSDQLPPQVLSRSLQAGQYYLRAIYLGNRPAGTSIQVWMVANPP